MGKYKQRVMEAEEALFQRAFNEWEVEKLLREMTLDEIDDLCKKIDEEREKRSKETDESTTAT